eukprot:TRINITY_DN468_c0_g2_i3.p3 TRINITY_DN468_c0_g2~~TRINITY_DN468_c0_g2_i3.p3  ORF type:complete len:389 (+),score=34.69 TRINITY_DN468_c0_g2_i3:43-1209(+)
MCCPFEFGTDRNASYCNDDLTCFGGDVIAESLCTSGKCTYLYDTNGKGTHILYEDGLQDTIEDCCALCQSNPGCNAFVYCPQESGCENRGNGDILPHKYCANKYYKGVADGDGYDWWYADSSTGFASGFIDGKQAPLSEDGLCSLRDPIILCPEGEYCDGTGECKQVPKSCGSQGETCCPFEFGSDRNSSYCDSDIYLCKNGEDVGNSLCTYKTQCTFQPQTNGKGSHILSEDGLQESVEDCCQLCQSNPGCNAFVYCPNEQGCENQGNGDILPYKYCASKYHQGVALGQGYDYWYQGWYTSFTSGYIDRKQAPISQDGSCSLVDTIVLCPYGQYCLEGVCENKPEQCGEEGQVCCPNDFGSDKFQPFCNGPLQCQDDDSFLGVCVKK